MNKLLNRIRQAIIKHKGRCEIPDWWLITVNEELNKEKVRGPKVRLNEKELSQYFKALKKELGIRRKVVNLKTFRQAFYEVQKDG
jgi:hypothetical protein